MIERLKSAVWAGIKRVVARSPALRRRLEYALEKGDEPFFPSGHFYSPVVDLVEAQAAAGRLWPDAPADLPDIALTATAQADFLDTIVLPQIDGFLQLCAGQSADDPLRFPPDNDQYGHFDSLVLYAMLHHARPRRIIEIGSGFSTLLMRAINHDAFDGGIEIACIEPFPRDFLRAPGIGVRLHDIPVQSAPLAMFSTLAAGDILFVDSSHVAKTGSDVNFIVFEILPRLADGVIVHIHDIFLPFEYPKQWVIDGRRSWNEQYVLRALLMGSRRYRPLFGAASASHACPRAFAAITGGLGLAHADGCSFWLAIESG